MNTIVMNTLNGAVTEYDWAFESITPNYAGSALGFYTLGGNTDAGALIMSTVKTGKAQTGTSKKALIEIVYFSLKGNGTSTMTLHGENTSYSYAFTVEAEGVSRAKPGLGIRENYLAFGYSNTDGNDFVLDQIEAVNSASTNRRTR